MKTSIELCHVNTIPSPTPASRRLTEEESPRPVKPQHNVSKERVLPFERNSGFNLSFKGRFRHLLWKFIDFADSLLNRPAGFQA